MHPIHQLLGWIRELNPAHSKVSYCAFIDILGFKKKLADWPAAVKQYADAMEAMLTAPTLRNLTAENATDEPWFESVGILVLSDAVILNSPRLQDLLHLSAVTVRQGLVWGIPMRGYISKGLHLQRSAGPHHLVVSQALLHAYEGERTLSVFPRVVIDRELVEQIPPQWATFIVQDEDNQWFVNPFGDELSEHDARRLCAFIKTALEQHGHNAALLAKYCWLADFFNALVFGEGKYYYSAGSFRARLRARIKELDPVRTEEEILPIAVWESGGDTTRRFLLPPSENYSVTSDGRLVWQVDGRSISQPDHYYKQSFEENWSDRCTLWAGIGAAGGN